MRHFVRTQWDILVLVVIVAMVPLLLQNDFHYELAILSMINAIICIGLNLLMGYAGQVSLGHGAFAGLGGYISAILATQYGLPPLLCVGISLVAMGLFAFVISKPILRLHGHYLAMATLGVGIIIHIALSTESQLTGGPDGMGVEAFSVGGLQMDSGIKWYSAAALFLVLLVGLVKNLIDSPFGRILRCIHDSEKAAATIGANVAYYKSIVFVISVVIATLAGSMYAFFSGFIAPSEASFTHSIELVVMVVFGGLGRIWGAVIGAVLLTLLPQLLTVFKEYETLVFGGIILFTMIFMPRGIISVWDAVLEKLRRGRAAD